MPTFTPNFHLSMPLVNNSSDSDLWGGELNSNISNDDTLLLTAMQWETNPQTAATVTVAPRTNGSTTLGGLRNLYLCNATANPMVVDLPTAASAGNGFCLAVKKNDSSSNAVTVTPNGADTIEGAATLVLGSLNVSYILVSDGVSNWNIQADNASTAGLAPLNSPAFTGVPTAPTAVSGTNTTQIATTAFANSGLLKGTLFTGTALTINPYAQSTASGAHGLAVIPTLSEVRLVCVNADQGYSVGDSLVLPSSGTNAGNAAFSVAFDAANIYFSGASSPSITNKNSASSGTINNSNWQLIITPYKVN